MTVTVSAAFTATVQKLLLSAMATLFLRLFGPVQRPKAATRQLIFLSKHKPVRARINRAKALVKRNGDPEEIMELCNKALEQFTLRKHLLTISLTILCCIKLPK